MQFMTVVVHIGVFCAPDASAGQLSIPV